MLIAQVRQLPPPHMLFIVLFAIVVLAIGFSISAVMLRASAFWFARKHIPFNTAFWTVFLMSIITWGQAVLFRLALYGNFPERNELDLSGLYGFPLVLLFYSLIISNRCELSLARSFLVYLGILLIGLVISLAIVFTCVVIPWLLQT